jgi:hypothetical protein
MFARSGNRRGGRGLSLPPVVGILNAIPTETLISTFHEQIKRLEAYIDTEGEYVNRDY